GQPHILGEAEIAETARGFSTYGLQELKAKPTKPAKSATKARAAAERRKPEKKRSSKR
ncbi:MAG: class II aldolase, partial [Bradyrhizobium sp.]|nr:class II aldolase [Bradyrhizobium sp.]